ncbi:MAG: tetratricopeptide repeat protein [Bacteroidales bacterium]|jgi:tetratricopeptide (TPR) repeat protein|nr:tetratricopeptide repeat protein [Bacteroidales bacterium]
MEQFERDAYDELIDRFRRMIRENKSSFFDSEEMEIIIEDLLFNFDFESCDKALDHAIATFPQLPIFYILKAKKYRMEIEFEKAEAELKWVEQRFPPSSELYKERYVLNSILNDNPKNYLLLLKAEKMDPIDPETQFLLSFEYLKQDELQKATRCISLAIREEEEYAEKLFHFSYYFESHGKYVDAHLFYTNLTEVFPLLKGAWFGLGLAYSWLNNYEEAISAYQYALSIDDDIPTAHFNIGNSYYDLEDYDSALKHYGIALELDPADYNSIACVGDCYYKMGQLDMAKDCYRQSLEINPENVDALYGMINLTKDGNNTATIRNYISKALAITPENFDLLFIALDLYNDEQCEEKLIEIFEQSLTLSENKALHFESFAIYCCVYQHFEEALLIFDRYHTCPDISQIVDYYTAAMHYLSGNIENGNRFLCNALMINFDDYRAFLRLDPQLEEIPEIINLIEIFRT